jgi:hypothetical protein
MNTNTKEIAYNALLPIMGTVTVPESATEEEIENAIYDDARNAASYIGTWKHLEVEDIYTVEAHLDMSQ